MTLTVYIIEKNGHGKHVFHKNKCWYASGSIIDMKAYYLTDVAFDQLLKTYPSMSPCRHCCTSLSQSYFKVSINSAPMSFGLEGFLNKRKSKKTA